MKQVIQLFAVTIFLSATYNGFSQDKKIEEIRNECIGTSAVTKPNLLISAFNVSAPGVSYGMGNEVATKLISHLRLITCFDYNESVSSFIDAGSQVIITGNLRDYYSSEGRLGKPRINFDIEIRSATTQELLRTKNINEEGKLYPGFGNNKPLANMWNTAMNQALVFLYEHLPLIALQSKKEEQVVKTGNSTVVVEDRVKTKSVLEQMEEHSTKKRKDNNLLNKLHSEYYNDTIVYKEYPKRPAEKFLEYTVDGKKYFFREQTTYNSSSASLHLTESLALTRNGIEIKIDPTTVICFAKIDMFNPAAHHLARRFHFGTDSTYDKRIPSSHESKAVFEIQLCGAFKDGFLKPTATDMYTIFASNDPKHTEKNNVEGGYVQVLEFKTSWNGIIECLFKFRTKSYTDSNGKKIPSRSIEGRFRARGKLSD